MGDTELKEFLDSIDVQEENDKTRAWLENMGLYFDDFALINVSDCNPE